MVQTTQVAGVLTALSLLAGVAAACSSSTTDGPPAASGDGASLSTTTSSASSGGGTCSGASVCAAAPPDGWDGPVAASAGTKAEGCSGFYPQLVTEIHAGL